MKTRELILLFYIIDLALMNIALLITSYFAGPKAIAWPLGALTIIFNLSWTFVYLISINDLQPLKASLSRLIRNLAKRFTAFFTIAAALIFGYEYTVEILPKAAILGVGLVFGILEVSLSIFKFFWVSQKGTKGKSDILIIGSYKHAVKLFHYCSKKTYLGYNTIGILSDNPEDIQKTHVIGTTENFQKIYDTTPFNDVLICLPLYEKERINALITLAEKNGIRPRVVPSWGKRGERQFKANKIGDISLLDIRKVPLYRYPNRFWKRAFDLAFASAALLFASPIFLILAIIIKMDSKGPVFYKPTRLGVNGKPFTVYKFRSMAHSNDASNATKSTVKNDSRITRIGKIMRKSNLDELPQLINVLKNEMSIVGPRPHRVFLNEKLKEKMDTYMVRHFIKPGITGWAQVNGWRGPTETRLQYKGRTLHDLWYVENWSFWIDFYIIYLTVFGKKVRKNAF